MKTSSADGGKMGVVGAARNVKTFGNIEGPVESTNKATNLSTDDMKKLGSDNVGEVLNKIADPNWVDPSKKMRTAGNDKLDKDAFFKLMLAQMKNQDPTNPLKSHEMAAQLANFSSLEQMNNMNQTLTEMKNGQKPLEQFQALNFIGKAVGGDSSKIARVKGDKEHDFRFTLGTAAAKVQIRIRNNDTGETIRTIDLQKLKEGDNKFVWNGQTDKGQPAPAGNYQMFAEAFNGNGGKQQIKTDFEGIITGVSYTAEGPVLMVGNQSVRMRDIKKIQDPSLMKNDQNINHVVESNLKKEVAANDTGSKQSAEKTLEANAGSANESVKVASNDSQGAPDAPVKMQQNLMETVGMSSEMKNKFAKELQP
jgi:flagellar basal-body rod modification protein FlgD